MSLRQGIEDAVIARLAALKHDQPGGYLRTLKPYQGSISPDDDDQDVNRQTAGRLPAVLVTTDNAEFDHLTTARTLARMSCDLVILVACDNLRSPEASARGDGHQADPGIYAILDAIRERLYGFDLGVDAVAIPLPLRERAIVRSGSKEIWQAVYRVDAEIETDPDAGTAEYTRIIARHNLVENDAADPITEGDVTLGS